MREPVFGDGVLSLDEYEKAVNALTEQDVETRRSSIRTRKTP